MTQKISHMERLHSDLLALLSIPQSLVKLLLLPPQRLYLLLESSTRRPGLLRLGLGHLAAHLRPLVSRLEGPLLLTAVANVEGLELSDEPANTSIAVCARVAWRADGGGVRR